MADIRVSLVLEDQQFTGKLNQATAGVDNFGKRAQASFNTAGQSTNAFGSALRNVGGGIADFGRGLDAVTTRVSGLATAIAGVGMVSFLSSIAHSASAVKDLSEAFGLSVSSVLELQTAFSAAGRSTEDMSRMLSELNNSALEAANGNEKARAAFERLGITQKELTSLSAVDIFAIIAKNMEAAGGSAQSLNDAFTLLGKSAKGVPFGDFLNKLNEVRGTMGEAAGATTQLDQTMKTIEASIAAVKIEFTKLIGPVAEAFGSFVKEGNNAKLVAEGLAVVMGLLAANLVFKGIQGLAGIFTGLAAALGLTGGAAAISAKGVDSHSAALARNMLVQQAATTAKASALAAEVELAAARAAGATGTAQAAALEATLEKLRWRSSVATANAAAATAGATAAQNALNASQGAGIVTSNGLSASTTLLGIRLGTLKTAALAAAAAFAIFYSPDLNQGEDEMIAKQKRMAEAFKGLSKEQLDAYYKLSAADQVRIQDQILLQQEAKKTGEIFDRVMSAGTKAPETKQNAGDKALVDTTQKWVQNYNSAAESLRSQYKIQELTNGLARERLQLQIKLVGASEMEKAVSMSAFEEKSKQRQEELRLIEEIRKLQLQTAAEPDKAKVKSINEQIGLLQQQLEKVRQQKDETTLLVAALKEAEDSEKQRLYYQELSLKISENVRDINENIADLNRSEDERRLAAVERQRDAEITSAVKRREADLGRNLTAEERLAIENKITEAYSSQIEASKRLNEATRVSENKKFGIDLENRALEEQIRLRAEYDSMTMTADQRRIRDIQTQTEMMARQEIIRRESKLAPGQKLSAEEQKQIYEQVAASNRAILETTQRNIAKSREFSTGWAKAFNEYQDEATNSAKKAGQLFEKISKGMEDSIVKFAKTGKFGFKEFANSVIEDLLRMEARTLSTKILGGATQMFGGGGGAQLARGEQAGIPQQAGGGGGSILGGLVSGIGKIFGGFFADGGMIPAGKYGIVGERGPEYVSGPAQVTPMGSSNVTYNINAVDAASFKALVAADPGFIHAVAQMGARTVPGRR